MRFALAALLVVSCLAAQQNTLTAEEQAAGWKLLFDGATSAGWMEVSGLPFPTTSWTVEDGCLKAFPNPDGIQDIRTAETFHSFDFRFEWKISAAGNSGVKYLVQRTDRWQRRGERGFQARARGLEYQIADDAANPDARGGPARRSAALYAVLAPANQRLAEAGVFHQSRIVVRDSHVEHWLDGTRVLEFDLDSGGVAAALRSIATAGGGEPAKMVTRDSFISLQNHASEVWFRNLKIRRLD